MRGSLVEEVALELRVDVPLSDFIEPSMKARYKLFHRQGFV